MYTNKNKMNAKGASALKMLHEYEKSRRRKKKNGATKQNVHTYNDGN